MRSLKYYPATSWEDAVEALTKHENAQVIAGGSDLLGWIKDDLHGPGAPRADVLVDIRTIPDTSYIRFDAASGLKIGALTNLTSIEESPDVQSNYPALAQAVGAPASPSIRNTGTLGGNLLQRPRCWYLRGREFPCYKKGGDFCFAVTGENQYNAILEGELCYIVHPSDTAPALIAFNATANVIGPGGSKQVPFTEFFIGPRVNVLKETVLERNEILTEVSVPAPAAGLKSAFFKVTQRDVYDFAIVSVAIAAQIENGVWQDGRVVLGGVAPTPHQSTLAEAALKGQTITEAVARQAAEQAMLNARPMTDNAYKVDMAKNLIQQAVMSLLS
ncbi:MAG TPA: xanthine dehydrogenase family protein subunit M [Anaerolineales bacterium]|nr:xanthine dehydrogenase family protein subunit M [Anaerolineales bacterium]